MFQHYVELNILDVLLFDEPNPTLPVAETHWLKVVDDSGISFNIT